MAFLARSFFINDVWSIRKIMAKNVPKMSHRETKLQRMPKKLNIRSELSNTAKTNKLSLISIKYIQVNGELITPVEHQSKSTRCEGASRATSLA